MIWYVGAAAVLAQATSSAELFSPELDGNSRLAQRFAPGPVGAADRSGPSRFGELPAFSFSPASGASVTGFDSANARRRGARGRALSRSAKPHGGRVTAAPAPVSPPRGVNAPARQVMPPRYVRRGAPDRERTSLLNVPTTLVTPRRPLPSVEDPYAPVGLRMGAFLLRPAIDLTAGYDSNPTRIWGLPGSPLFIVAPELQVRSDWRRHALNADLRGSYNWYAQRYNDPFEGPLGTPENIDRPNVDSRVNGRLDMTKLSQADLEARYLVSTDNPGSPNIQAGLRRFPIVTTLGGTIGFTQAVNRFEFVAKGFADHISYEASRLTDGTKSSNEDRDYNQYKGTLRAGYELKPGLKPFVEVGAYTRAHELPLDRNGFARDSDGRFAKAGSTFEFTRKLTGEIAVGYLKTEYKDARLTALSGPTIDGSLIYTATPLTTFTLTATTTANEIVTPGVSGLFSRDVNVRIDHAFRRWLIGTVRFGYGLDDYVGSVQVNQRYFVSFAMLHKISREVQIKAEYRRDWLHSNLPDLDWNANTVLLGVRLQR